MQNTDGHRPPAGLQPLRLAGEAGSGLVMGILGAVVGRWLGQAIGEQSATGWGDLVGIIVGGFVGYVLGVPVGVTMMARWLKQSGVAWRAVAGSVLGGVGSVLLAEPLRLNQSSVVLITAIGILSVVGAMVGFHSRRQRYNPRRDADPQ